MSLKLFSTCKNIGPFNVLAYATYDEFPYGCPLADSFGNVALFKEGNPEEIYDTHKNNPWAFPISCYSHGSTYFFLQGSGPSCTFDTTSFCGYYYLYDGSIAHLKTLKPDDQKKLAKEYAKEDLKRYSDWVNGEVYEILVAVNEKEEELYTSEIYGFDTVKKEIQAALESTTNSLEQVLNNRQEVFFKLAAELKINFTELPAMLQKYVGFYKPVLNIENSDSVPVNYFISDSSQSIIEKMNKEDNSLLHLCDLDKNPEESFIKFKLGYTLVL